jgi:hypothetical protein
MALEDSLRGIREASAKRIPADKAAIMHRATEELRASGIMERVIKVGDRLPLGGLRPSSRHTRTRARGRHHVRE